MKIAIVCDDLVQYGGQEKVVMDICNVFPNAVLYTPMATKEWKSICSQKGITLKTSFMQRLPFKKRLNRFYAPLLFYILALEKFNFNDFDVVISVSSRFAHGVLTQPKTLHICYMNTVGRMFWEPNEYFSKSGGKKDKTSKGILRRVLALPLSYVRVWDRMASTRPDFFFANAITTQKRIKKYYNLDSEVFYPGVDPKQLTSEERLGKKDYYLVLTRLARWKRVDLAINACKNLGLNLKIIGDGPDRRRLQNIVRGCENIELLGRVSNEDKVRLLSQSKALIMTQFEDFGLVPIEAMYCGTPTIAFKKGGALETVIAGEAGEFFEEQNEESLSGVLKDFDHKKYKTDKLKEQADKFGIDNFNNALKTFVVQQFESYKKS